ncbi:MAG: hypothetical protein AVO33_02675 [delta proteobacterium ML8_F1]|nr:MAG: hypothetical protein AVO33_02675 [delta proteobacterium ML8_F1]
MRILLTGGGTGGHVYPALAIKEALESLDKHSEFLYVGTRRGIESRIVPGAGVDFETLEVEGLNKRISIQTFKSLFKLLRSLFEARRILRTYDPDIVIGTGGYVSFPVVFVAGLMKKRIFLHEQNAFPGVANRWLSRYAEKLFLSYPESQAAFRIPGDRMAVTGNPVRRDFEFPDREREKLELGLTGKKVILAFGGSGGALAINELTLSLAGALADEQDIRLILGSGKRYFESFSEKGRGLDNLEILEYIDSMPRYMGACDLVIARSGAITLAEIAAMGLPSVLVPSPHVANDHQMKNARVFESAGAAWVVAENEKGLESVPGRIRDLIHSGETLETMGENARHLHRPNSAKLIAEEILREI